MQLKNEIKFETLHKSHKKRIIIGVVTLCVIGTVLVFKTTRAKYRFTQSIPFVRGTINYKPYDFKMMAMYQQKDNVSCTEDNCYNAITGRMPGSEYKINESKSYCTIDGTNKDTQAILKTVKGIHSISNLASNEKCYLYFDRAISLLLAKYTKVGARANFGTLTSDNSGKVYSLEDDDGTSYYFAGAVNNNWVKFAGFYWRIVRFNGDGTMRLIYSGTTSATTGPGTQIGTSAFNSTKNDNMYVGYRYTSGDIHGTGNSSTIQGVIDAWFKTNIADKGYEAKIDMSAGFCGDREPSTSNTTSNGAGGKGTDGPTFYGAYIRFAAGNSTVYTPTPTYKCKNANDLYTKTGANKGNKSLTYSVGLITADEVNVAGALYKIGNTSYYLYNSQDYWTMSPAYYNGISYMFIVASAGNLGNSNSAEYGVRPVINLRADTTFKSGGNGTSSSPYEVL